MDNKEIFDKMGDSSIMRRFRAIFRKWQELSPEQNVVTVSKEDFLDTILPLFASAAISNFRVIRTGLHQFLIAAEELGYGIDMDAKHKQLEKLTSTEVELYRAGLEAEEDRHRTFFANPVHLRDELRTCFGSQPSSMAIAFMLQWMNIGTKEAVLLPKDALSPDCTSILYNGRENEIPEPFQEIFRDYKNTDFAYMPNIRLAKEKINGPYLLKKVLRQGQYRVQEETINTPLKPQRIFAQVSYFNAILSEKHGRKIEYSIEGVSISSAMYGYHQMLKTGCIVSLKEHLKKMFPRDRHAQGRHEAKYAAYIDYCNKYLSSYFAGDK